jgi:hypothetical protein
MKYYDTVIWAVGNEESNTLSTTDQLNLIDWLGEGAEGGERNLLIAGDNVGREVVGEDGDALGFYADWLAAEYLGDAVGEVTEDSLPTLRDADSAFDFMTYDDRRCRLRGGCPRLSYFDVVGPDPARPTAERVAEYVRSDMAVLPAGVACTDTLTGYQAVTLGFGLESMVGVLLPTGDYLSGAQDRADLMSNIMDYFGRAPTGPGTGVSEDTVHAARLGYARPNPFNPRTTIEYGVAKDGPVVVRIFDLSGRLVRTLVDADLAAGDYRAEWYGRDDEGREAASGVYFVRIEAKGFADGRKIVLLK